METGSKNTITLDFASSPDLAALFTGKEPGDKCTIEITLQVGEISDQGISGTIEKVTSDYDSEDEKEAKPKPDAPMAIAIMPMELAE